MAAKKATTAAKKAASKATAKPAENTADAPTPDVDRTPVEVEMRTRISGTRNGEAWPAVGERIELPGDEAAGLVTNGDAVYAAELED